MHASGHKSLPAFGFLTVLEQSEQGICGGYLILNAVGRPLEFHCTAPVKPNRAQEILYGPTLKPYLYGEQIGQTLLAKAKTKPLFVCVDVEPVLHVRDFVNTPVLLVRDRSDEHLANSPPHLRIDDRHHGVRQPASSKLVLFSLGQHQLAVPAAHDADRERIVKQWQASASQLDLWEPFGRIREAIEEAQRSAAN